MTTAIPLFRNRKFTFLFFLAVLLASSTDVVLADGAALGPTSSGLAAGTPATTVAAPGADAQAELRAYFFEAARRGDSLLIDTYVKAGIPVDLRTQEGYTALILAAYHGEGETVDKLIALGADVCAKDKRGNTALMGAAFKGELTIAKKLLDAPCSKPDQRNELGQTAAMYAGLAGNEKLISLLKNRGANLHLQDVAGASASSLARGQGADALADRIDGEPVALPTSQYH